MTLPKHLTTDGKIVDEVIPKCLEEFSEDEAETNKGG